MIVLAGFEFFAGDYVSKPLSLEKGPHMMVLNNPIDIEGLIPGFRLLRTRVGLSLRLITVALVSSERFSWTLAEP